MPARYSLPALVSAVLLAGCVNSQVEQRRSTPAPSASESVVSDASIVVLGRRQNFKHQTELDFTQCVGNKLASRNALPLMSEDQFVDRMFPWFEPRVAPLDVDALAERLRTPVVEARLKETGIRYVVWLDGVTTKSGEGGQMSCGVSPAGGGCLGLVWWEKQAAYEAAVWDMQNLQSVGQIKVDASGTSYVPALIVPVPLIARTQAAACDDMADQVQELLSSSGS